jgi:predicted RecA/RadA family phage recombinase
MTGRKQRRLSIILLAFAIAIISGPARDFGNGLLDGVFGYPARTAAAAGSTS